MPLPDFVSAWIVDIAPIYWKSFKDIPRIWEPEDFNEVQGKWTKIITRENN